MPHSNPQPFSMPTPMADSPAQMHSIASPAVKQEHNDILVAFNMPTPQTTDPALTNLPPPETIESTSRPAADEDTEMRNASPGDGRVAVKPIYQPETETQPVASSAPAVTSAPEPVPQSAPVAPMTNVVEVVSPQQPEESVKVSELPVIPESAAKEAPNGPESHLDAPPATHKPTEVPNAGSAVEESSALVSEKDLIGSPTGSKGRKNSHSSDSSTSIHLSPKDPNPLLHPYETGEYLFTSGDGP